MKYSASGNAILPNTFQHPNVFIDRLMYYLDPEENTVLTFAVRRILGFQENISSRKDNISLSQFVDGIRSSKTDEYICLGCGLGTNAVRKALDGLEKFKVLIPTTEKPDPRNGQEYWLQENEKAIDWQGLEERKAARIVSSQKSTEKARYVVGQQARGIVAQQAKVLRDNNTKPIETHGNPKTDDDEKNDNFKILANLYFENIGMATPLMADTLKDAAQTFPVEWFKPAFEIAVANNARNWRYISVILQGWKDHEFGWKPGADRHTAKPQNKTAESPSTTPTRTMPVFKNGVLQK